MSGRESPSLPSDQLSLKQRVLGAGGWSIAGYGLGQAIRFGTNLVMTRLLVPEMFGVMAIATLVMMGLAMFSDVGLRQNVVQSKRGSDAAFLNTAWAIQILRGVLLCFCTMGASLLLVLVDRMRIVPVDSVYADPSLPQVIAALSISAVIQGFESTKLLQASRKLTLQRLTQMEIGSQVAGLMCMFGWVAVDRSIWALVAGSIFSTLVRVILSHVWLAGVANRWQWDDSAFREIIDFGKWILLSSILGFLVNSGDRVLLGWLVDTNVLGLYVIAFLIFSSIEGMLTKFIGDVSFPALSEVARERPTELRASHYRFHVVIASSAYFISGVLMVSGEALIGLLYDRRYAEAGWMLQILAAGLLAVPFRVAMQCFMALGMPRLFSQIIAVRLVTLFLFTTVGFDAFGLSGALWGIVLSYFAGLPLIIFYQVKYGLLNLLTELLMLPVVLGGMIGGHAFRLVAGY